MISAPVLFTERLMLRPPLPEDIDGFTEFYGDPQTMHFLGGSPLSRAEAYRSMCMYAGAFALSGVSMFSVIERASDKWIGRLGPWSPEGWPGTEVGWGLVRSAEGKGFATEATIAAMDYAVDVLGWTRIIHTIDPENAASIALAKRLGSSNLGPTHLPAPFADKAVDAWGQTSGHWRTNRRNVARR